MKRKVALTAVAIITAAALTVMICFSKKNGERIEKEPLKEEKPLFETTAPKAFSDNSVYKNGVQTGAVFDNELSAEKLGYYNSIGINYVITENMDENAENYTVSIILIKKEGETANEILKKASSGGVYLAKDEIDGASLEFLANESGKAVITENESGITVYANGEIQCLALCDVLSLSKTEELLDFWSAQSDEIRGIAFTNPQRIFENDNALGDAVASILIPSLRYDMTALTVGIPSKRTFSTKYANVWLVGGSNPSYPLYLNGKEVNRTSNGLFSVKVELTYGKNEIILSNGEEALTFNVTTSSSYYSVENKASSPESAVGKTAVIDGKACPLLFTEVPIKSNESSVYAPDLVSDEIVERLTAKNELNGKTLDLYRLKCGYYVETKYVSVTEGEISQSQTVDSLEISLLENWLTFSFSTSGNPFFTVYGENGVRIEIFGRAEECFLLCDLPQNPIFETAAVERLEEKTVINLTLKEGASLFGWDSFYSENKAVIKFRLPKRLAEGNKPLSGITVMLDAGHSNNYGGTQGPDYPYDLKERELTYKVATVCKGYLEELGATVILSRDETTTEILYASEVKTWYHPSGADIGVSIHFNALTETANSLSRSGVLTIYSNSHSKLLSDTVAKNTSLYANRPFKASSKSDYIICHLSYLPSIIIECGYLTNVFEYDWFLKEENVDWFGAALSRSVYDYFALQDALCR